MLDTNVVIGLLNRSPPAHEIALAFGINLAGNAVSQISRMELLGFAKLTLEDEKGVRNFLADCDVILIDDQVEAETILFRRRTKLALPDAIVAATAVVHGLELVSLDKRLMRTFKGWKKT